MTWYFDKVQPWITSIGQQLGGLFGIGTIYGWRPDDGRPSEHPKGRALDFMTTTGTPLAEYARENANTLGVSYIVWNRQIWSKKRAAEGWRPYTGTSNPHTDHVHISFDEKAPVGGALVNTVGNLGQQALGGLFNVDELMGKVRGTSITVAGALLGLGLIGAGLFLAVKQRAATQISKLVK
jgi:hypothetical protein